MAIYCKETFTKDKKGEWKSKKCEYEKVPCSVEFWKRNNLMEQNSKIGEHSYLSFSKIRNGVDVVDKVCTYFGKNERVVRTLVTTSNLIPKSRNKDKNLCFCE